MPLEITFMPAPRVLANPALSARLLALCEPYYTDPEAVLESSLERADRVALAGAAPEDPQGFFCVSTHALPDSPDGFGRLEYGGLAVTSLPRRSQGLLARLLKAWRDDIHERQRDDAPALVCGITCHVFMLQLARAVFTDTRPDEEGGHDAEGARLAALIQRTLFEREADPSHPFHLLGITPTRYREDFLELVSEGRRLRAWGIDERRGDRLLITCRCG